MGEYATVHVTWTIPALVVLVALYFPLRASPDVYRTTFLVAIAVVSTIPWDSYLIRSGVWTYPRHVILGPTLFSIPVEEVFFFVIQTCITTLVYLLVTKPLLHVVYLPTRKHPVPHKTLIPLVSSFIAVCLLLGLWLTIEGGRGLYLGLILIWSCPFILFLWIIASSHILSIPAHTVFLPIILPTAFLWTLDTCALRRGTWVIESGTKLDISLWSNFDVEEALFFLITNIMIVFGQVAFDKSYAIITANPALSTVERDGTPSVSLLLRALVLSFSSSSDAYDHEAIDRLRHASKTLQNKSRSFWIASALFESSLRIDLVNLYSFCRVADDIVDEDARTQPEARRSIHLIRKYIDALYGSTTSIDKKNPIMPIDAELSALFVSTDGDGEDDPRRAAFRGLPHKIVPKEPLMQLLEGFEMDVAFKSPSSVGLDSMDEGQDQQVPIVEYPIRDEDDLIRYAECVAGTVAEMCCHLIFHYAGEAKDERPNSPSRTASSSSLVKISGNSTARRVELIQAAIKMGVALQLVNIARDIETDAREGRVYIPMTWWSSPSPLSSPPTSETPTSFVSSAARNAIYRTRLLALAEKLYAESRPAIEEMPEVYGARRGLRVAVDSYMEIGRYMRRRGNAGENASAGEPRRASVPKWRRLWLAWWTLARQ